jgi:hypothetical protein
MSIRAAAEAFVATFPCELSYKEVSLPRVLISPADQKIFPAQSVLRHKALDSLKGVFTSGKKQDVPPIKLLKLEKPSLKQLISQLEISDPVIEAYFDQYQENELWLVIDGCHRLTTALQEESLLWSVVFSLPLFAEGTTFTTTFVEKTHNLEIDQNLIAITISMFLSTLKQHIFSVQDLITKGSLVR